MLIAVSILLLICVGAFLYIARPFLGSQSPGASVGAVRETISERVRFYGVLNELEEDYRGGKLAPADFFELSEYYRGLAVVELERELNLSGIPSRDVKRLGERIERQLAGSGLIKGES